MSAYAFTLLAQSRDTSNVSLWTMVFVGLSFTLYLTIAWISRVSTTRGFYVAGQGIPAIANGMATGADWMSAASFIGMAGLISTMGYAGGVYLMGWTGGYVLLALLLAPYLRKFGHFTVPDFIGDRYASQSARLVAVICAIFVSFTYVVGQMKGVGVVFSRFLGVELEVGVFVGMVIVFIYATLGGMKGITWTQVAQYWVLITAFLIPATAISFKLTGQPVPQIGLGSTVRQEIDPSRPYMLEKLNQINQDFGFASYTEPFIGKWNRLNVFCVALALMAGTAGLPHVIVRFYTVRTVKAARWSAFWALLFIAVLYLTAPAVGAFARYYMVDPVAGLNGRTEDELPGWYRNWESSGLICWLDLNADQRVQYTANTGDSKQVVRASETAADAGRTIEVNELFIIDKLPTDVRAAIRQDRQKWVADHGDGIRARDELLAMGGKHGPDKDIIVLATPEMAELFDWIVALVAAGGLAAALSTASGLLLVISSSVAHDLYYRMFAPQATEKQRLIVGRVAIAGAVVIAGYFGIHPPGFVGEVVAFAFGLAAASFFPAIVLGIFSKRVGTVPAMCGMLTGLLFTAFYILTQKADTVLLSKDVAAMIFGTQDAPNALSFLRQPWMFGIDAQGIGTVGMALNFVITLALTPFFPPPSAEVRELIDSVREPEGISPAVNIEQAIDH